VHSHIQIITRMAFKIRPFSLFKVQSACLRVLGFWPGPENQALQRKHFVLSVMNCVFTISMQVFQLNFIVNGTEDVSVMMESILLFITRIAIIVKMVVYLLKHNELKLLLETFDNLVTEGGYKKWWGYNQIYQVKPYNYIHRYQIFV
jgi:hypothetical protein